MNNNQHPEFKKALCWELSNPSGSYGINAYRVAVAGQYVLTQELRNGNERPRWSVEDYNNEQAATERALSVTSYAETVYGATLTVSPTEVILHQAELTAMRGGDPIPPSLRARIFTALHRQRNAD